MKHFWLLGLTLGALALYSLTLSPGVLPADSGEFQLVAATLGIAHPPGYPLYTLLGWAFTRLTPHDPAWGLNLLSTLLATATLAVVYTISVSLATLDRDAVTAPLPDFIVGLAGLIAALALMGATTFWAAATTANIRILVGLLTALLIWLALRALADPTPRRLAWLGLVTGLALSHHGSLLFTAAPVWLAVLWAWLGLYRRGRRGRRAEGLINSVPFAVSVLAAGLGGIVGLTPWLYLLVRGAPGTPPQAGGLTTLAAWLDHILARGFGGDMFAFARPDRLPDRLLILADILRFQFGWPLVVMGLVGMAGLMVTINPFSARQRVAKVVTPVAFLLLATFVIPAFVAITYRAPQTVEYLMPAYIPLALLIAYGAVALSSGVARLGGRLKPLFPSHLALFSRLSSLSYLLYLLPLALAAWNVYHLWPSYAELRRDRSTEVAAAALLQAAPPGAALFAGWHQATPLWYLQYVAGLRPDVQVTYVLPAGAEQYPQTWRRLLEQATQSGPALATHYYSAYQGAPFTVIPTGAGFLVQRDDPTMPDDFARVDTAIEGAIRLVGARWPGWSRPNMSLPRAVGSPRVAEASPMLPIVQAGATLTVDVFWQTEGEVGKDTSFFVHLLDGGGQVVGQADVSRAGSALGVGRRWVTRHRITVLSTSAPGMYRVVAGGYRAVGDALVQLQTVPIPLGDVEVIAPYQAPVTQQMSLLPQRFSTVSLIGWAWDTTLPDQTRLLLTWRRDQPGEIVRGQLEAGETRADIVIAPAQAGQYLVTATDVAPDTAATLVIDGQRVALGKPGAERWLSFGGEMALVGVHAVRQGDELVVDLNWLALRPLTDDYTMSIKARGAGWTAQHDGTPAQGAVPTLKWVKGMQVRDRHRLTLPANAPGPISITVGVYDAFTAALLGVQDDRLLKLGQGEEAVVLTLD